MEIIFNKKPSQWGLRGDPYLWGELKDWFLQAEIPKDVNEFEKFFHEAFHEICSEKLRPEQMIHIDRYPPVLFKL